MKARDIPRTDNRFYVQPMVYPKPRRRRRRPPLAEMGVTTAEIAPPYRNGTGVAVRLPLTRVALVIGTWLGSLPGKDDDDKLEAALRSMT